MDIIRDRVIALRDKRNFSMLELMICVTGLCFILGIAFNYGVSVLLGTVAGAGLALGIGSLVAIFTRPRRTPVFAAFTGIFVAHISVIWTYYLMPSTNIREWSIFEYLVQCLFACGGGAIAALPRSTNPVLSTVLGLVGGGAIAIFYVLGVFLTVRFGDVLRSPAKEFDSAIVFFEMLGEVGVLVGGATGCLVGMSRLFFHLRAKAKSRDVAA